MAETNTAKLSNLAVSTEIELKYEVPSASVRDQLLAVDRVGPFELQPAKEELVHDVYLDTPGRLVERAGYVLRVRTRPDQRHVTLKGLKGSPWPIHKREEVEEEVDDEFVVNNWPGGDFWDRITALTENQDVGRVIEIKQVRLVRDVVTNGRVIAGWSLDDVSVIAGDSEHSFVELEIELEHNRDEPLLQKMHEVLVAEYDLRPMELSKFERARSLMGD